MLGHDAAVYLAQFSTDGDRIASSSDDKTVRWWDAATGRPIGRPLRVDDNSVEWLYFFGEDRLLSYGKVDGVHTGRLWDARTLKPIGEPLPDPTDSGLFFPADSHD